MMKKVHILFLMAIALLPVTARAAEVVEINGPGQNDSVATATHETSLDAINLADTVRQ